MKSILLRAFLGVAALLSSGGAFAADRKPNIVLIVSDDQGYSDLGIIGRKPIITPNLDRLAREGVRGTNFYVTWPACTPSRSSILTGRYPQRNGLYDMIRNDMINYGHKFTAEEYAVSPEMTLGLDPREKTLGDVMRTAGYRNAVVGKWDMGQARRFLPIRRGFDYFYGHGNNGIDYYTHERYSVHSMFKNEARTEEDKGTYATDLFEREAVRFLRQTHDKPFFLYLCFNAPHGASNLQKVGVQATPEYIARYPSMDPKERITSYYAAVTHMDAAIGEVMKTLSETAQDKNSVVIFMSDNGGSGNGGNEPLRGRKSTMWEGGLRVPFIAWWPGNLPAGKVTDEFLTSLELMPTLAAITGAQTPAGVKLDGFDMLPILRGEKKSPRTEMFWERRSHRAARVDNWKWVDIGGEDTGLFDLNNDIGETRDLSKEKPDVLAKVRGRFEAWKREMEAAEPRGPFRDY